MNEHWIRWMVDVCAVLGGVFVIFLGRGQLRQFRKHPEADSTSAGWKYDKRFGYSAIVLGPMTIIIGIVDLVSRLIK